MRKMNLLLHRWFGIIVGLYFVALGLSGSYLVYPEYFERLLNRDLYFSNQLVPSNRDLKQIVLAAQKGVGIDTFPAEILLPASNENAQVIFRGLPGTGRGSLLTFIDVNNYQFLGQLHSRETLRGYLFRFHHDLFMGSVGKGIVAIAGIMIFLILISGLFLWWPRNGGWRKAFSLGSVKTIFLFNFNLHRFLGFYSLILMIMVTLTGVYIARPDWFGYSQRRPVVSSSAVKEIDLSKLDNILSQDVSGEEYPLEIRFKSQSDIVQVLRGTTESFFSWSALAKVPKSEPSFDLRRLQAELHEGDFWGEFGRALVFVSGLLPLFFYVSGIYIWIKKQPKRKRSNL